ncbi:MAG: hypothetical protein J5486_09005, partial [Bacteroidaceae bacterium]|nr:hypothetical protein [Bacteroidaceae bacterium]
MDKFMANSCKSIYTNDLELSINVLMLMRKYILICILLSCLSMVTRGQTITDADYSDIIHPSIKARSLRFWFDSNADKTETVSVLSGAYSLDVSALDEGIHTLHYQVIGVDGKGYGLSSHVFLKVFSKELEPAT